MKVLSCILSAFILMSPMAGVEAKKGKGLQPLSDTLGGITLGKDNKVPTGWVDAGVDFHGDRRYIQPPQYFIRDEGGYSVQGEYGENKEGNAVYSMMIFRFDTSERCEDNFKHTFANFARAHNEPTKPSGNWVLWSTEGGYDVSWQAQCQDEEAQFILRLQ